MPFIAEDEFSPRDLWDYWRSPYAKTFERFSRFLFRLLGRDPDNTLPPNLDNKEAYTLWLLTRLKIEGRITYTTPWEEVAPLIGAKVG